MGDTKTIREEMSVQVCESAYDKAAGLPEPDSGTETESGCCLYCQMIKDISRWSKDGRKTAN